MDGQQRRLGHRVTPEPLDILAFSGRKNIGKVSPFSLSVQICRILKLESPTDEFAVGISGNVSLRNHIPNFKGNFKEYLFYESGVFCLLANSALSTMLAVLKEFFFPHLPTPPPRHKLPLVPPGCLLPK